MDALLSSNLKVWNLFHCNNYYVVTILGNHKLKIDRGHIVDIAFVNTRIIGYIFFIKMGVLFRQRVAQSAAAVGIC